MKIGVIVVAAGSGKRMGGRVPKGFMAFRGKPLFAHCLEAFRRTAGVCDVVLVVPPGRLEWVLRKHAKAVWAGGVTKLVTGGERRQDSVGRGLGGLAPECDVGLVHDAARPCVTARLATAVARAALKWGAAVPGLPRQGTGKRGRGGRAVETPDRAGLVAVQTPQGVRAALLRRAYARGLARRDATDDVQLVERLGGRVQVVPGEPRNLKITSREDRALAEYFCTSRFGGSARA